MVQIIKADKVERITSVTLKSYDGTITFGEDRYNRGRYSVTVRADNPVVNVLDDLLRFAQPQEDECPVREVTLQSLIDELQKKRDSLNEQWGTDKGKPRQLALDFTFDLEEIAVIKDVLGSGDISYDTRTTVRKALATSVESEW